MSKLSRKLNDAKKTSPLLQYASDVTSQGGEDGIIDHLFNNIIPWHTTEKRFCVDVGAWDGNFFFVLLHGCRNNGFFTQVYTFQTHILFLKKDVGVGYC